MLNNKKEIDINEFYNVVFNNNNVSINSSSLNKIENCYKFLKDFSKDKIIYGINTGFGPMAQYKVDFQNTNKLQYNLIRSHSSGTGNPIPKECIKASMLARLNTLCLGNSAISKDVVVLLKNLINKNILPVIYEHGGVGASGDLVQLAHIALTLIGEGDVHYNGQIKKTKIVFKKEKLKPINLKLRDGLALMNGTSVMTGIGLINTIYTKRLLDWILVSSIAINEIVSSYDDHFSFELNQSKKHFGQREIAKRMRNYLKNSKLIRKREKHLYAKKANVKSFFKDKVQEYYSLRCVPQILGPALDTINNCESILLEEINSANDNPIIDPLTKQVYHGGNFHGDYVSLEMDKLKLIVTKITILSERQLNFLLNPKLNNILPPFVNLGKIGVNFGMQGAQFTATSTTAENQMLSNSMYVHSIPSNNDNQDIVSMGTNSSLICNKVINNAYEVLAIELITIIQSIDFLKIDKKVCSKTKSIYDKMRKIFPEFKEDKAIHVYINKVKKYIINNDI